jgi:predicted AAA+ superfamily ATPase
LLLHLVGADPQRLAADPAQTDTVLGGMLLENFVAMELMKQRGWSVDRPKLHHFRTHNGDEVDIVLEDPAGRIVGIEVKSTVSLTAAHFKGLKVLAEVAGDRFVRGILLHPGRDCVPFGRNLMAMPVGALWADYTAQHQAAGR